MHGPVMCASLKTRSNAPALSAGSHSSSRGFAHSASGFHLHAYRTVLAANEARGAAPASADVTPLADLERQAILDTLRQLNGDKLTTARLLGIGKTTLYRKLKEYGIGEFPAGL